jgi:hypothetical protein
MDPEAQAFLRALLAPFRRPAGCGWPVRMLVAGLGWPEPCGVPAGFRRKRRR